MELFKRVFLQQKTVTQSSSLLKLCGNHNISVTQSTNMIKRNLVMRVAVYLFLTCFILSVFKSVAYSAPANKNAPIIIANPNETSVVVLTEAIGSSVDANIIVVGTIETTQANENMTDEHQPYDQMHKQVRAAERLLLHFWKWDVAFLLILAVLALITQSFTPVILEAFSIIVNLHLTIIGGSLCLFFLYCIGKLGVHLIFDIAPSLNTTLHE